MITLTKEAVVKLSSMIGEAGEGKHLRFLWRQEAVPVLNMV